METSMENIQIPSSNIQRSSNNQHQTVIRRFLRNLVLFLALGAWRLKL